MVTNKAGKIINPNQGVIKPQKPLTIQEAVAGLMRFMNQQMEQNHNFKVFNTRVQGDLVRVNKELYEPHMREKQNLVCMSAIM